MMINKMVRNQLMLFMLCFIVVGLPAINDVFADEKTYILGVFPHLPPRELEKFYAPIAADLSKMLGKSVKFRTTTTYAKFVESIDAQVFDIAMMQPFDYIYAADKYGYIPLVTRTEALATLVVVLSGSPITQLSQLRGKKIALPPATAAVSRLLKIHLRQQGIDPNKEVNISHQRSHVSCLKQVLIGAADACGSAAPSIRFFNHRMKVKLKVIAKTADIPHTLFVAHPRVLTKDREVLLSTMLSWGKSVSGRALLKRGKLKPFVPVTDKDYDIVRELDKQG